MRDRVPMRVRNVAMTLERSTLHDRASSMRQQFGNDAVIGTVFGAMATCERKTTDARKNDERMRPHAARLCRNRGPAMLKSLERMICSMKQNLNLAVAKVFKRLHYPLDVILCVRRYVAYPLSLRHLEQMRAERGIFGCPFDCAWLGAQTVASAGESVPTAQAGDRQELGSWRIDETYIRVRGEWNICTAQWTQPATRSISCDEPIVTRLRPGATSKRRSPRTANRRP